ncbi:MAG: PAS domain S-box protein [Methanoregula sp.]|nr:PAS domain S-box protein [Methanoregula sp.]
MTAGKKKPEEKKPDISGTGHSLRDDAEKQLARSPKPSPGSPVQTAEALIHELQVHQIELEIQAEELRKSKIALEESRDTYLDLYDFAPVGYLTLNDKALITGANLTGAKLLGLERSRLINAPFSKFVEEKDTGEWRWYFMNVLNQEEKRTCTLMLKRGGGPLFPAQLEAILIPNSDGANTVRLAIIDITESRRAEEELRESEARFRKILEMAPLPLCYVNVNGVITYRNERFVQIFGYTADDVPTLTEWWQQAYPDAHYRQWVTTTWDAAVKHATEHGIDIKPVEYTVTCKSGEERIIEISGITLGDDFLATFIDLTERKVAEAALKESEERLRTIILSMQFGIVIIDAQTHTILEANDKALEMIGGTSESVAGSVCHRFICPAELGKCPVTDLGQNIDSSERVLLNLRGEKLPILKSVIRITLGGKDVLIESFIDITERKKAEEALALASKKLALLSGITRHDINNQLTILMGYLIILQKKQPDPSFSDYFQKVSTAAQRISSMIEFTKEYEKIGVKAPAWQDCRILVDTAVKQAPLGQVVVKNDLPTGAELFADPLIVKVFYNLMDNAVRYGGKITTIRFFVQEHEGNHVVICEDDGDGVVAQEKEKIFQRGFGKNTGLGLALSKEILEITGISIAENGEPGKGARFEMVVPKGAWRMTGKGA